MMAYQQGGENHIGMKLILNNGIFFEFIPFNNENFDEDGNVRNNAKALTLKDVKEGEEYVILVTTNAGSWRYIIGDTVRFTSVVDSEIIVTGRTKFFLSICGEHLSVDNMNRAIELLQQDLNIEIREFAVAGIRYDSLFAHQWYIGTDNHVDNEELKIKLDKYLGDLNDDYRVERLEAIKEIFITILPNSVFNEWMKLKHKEGGAHKFPRVLKSSMLEEWNSFIKNKGY